MNKELKLALEIKARTKENEIFKDVENLSKYCYPFSIDLSVGNAHDIVITKKGRQENVIKMDFCWLIP